MDIAVRNFKLDYHSYGWSNDDQVNAMTKQEAKSILEKIGNNPSIADQFTEDEIEEIESIASK